MDLADQVGAALTHDFGAVFVAQKIALDIELAAPAPGSPSRRRIRRHDRRDSRANGSSGDGWIGLGSHRNHAAAAAGFGARTPSRWQIATIRSARFSV